MSATLATDAGIDLTVEIDLSGTPYGDTPDFTDVTDDVWLTGGDGVRIPFWGRQDGTSDISVASCQFKLDNGDGRYTPGRAASPYSPNVRHGARVRVRTDVTIPAGGLVFVDNLDGTATVTGPTGFAFDRGNGTVLFLIGAFTFNGDGTATYTGDDVTQTIYLFDGLIDSWRTVWEGGVYPLTEVSATDMLGRMGADVPLRPMLYEEILKTIGPGNSGLFYPLNDTGPTFGDIGPAAAFTTAVRPTAYVGSGGPDIAYQTATGCADTAVTGVGLGGFFSYLGGIGFGFGGSETALLFFTTTFTGVAAGLLNDSDDGLYVGIDATGRASDGTNLGPFVADGLLHLLAIVDGDGWYIDGVRYGGDIGIDTINAIGFNLVGAVFCFTVIFASMTAARMVELLDCARTGFAGESTDAHSERLLGYRTNFGSVLEPGFGTVGMHPTAGVTLQQAFYDTANAEGGVVYADGQGRIVQLSRGHLFDTAPVWIMDVADAQVESSTEFVDDKEFVVNDVTVTPPSGAAQRWVDQDSVDQDGPRTRDVSLIVGSDDEALAAAKWRVQVGTQEQTAPPQLDVNLRTLGNANAVAALLQLRPTDVVRVDNTPDTAPDVTDFMVQGGSFTIGAAQFDISLFTTVVPAGDPY